MPLLWFVEKVAGFGETHEGSVLNSNIRDWSLYQSAHTHSLKPRGSLSIRMAQPLPLSTYARYINRHLPLPGLSIINIYSGPIQPLFQRHQIPKIKKKNTLRVPIFFPSPRLAPLRSFSLSSIATNQISDAESVNLNQTMCLAGLGYMLFKKQGDGHDYEDREDEL